MGGITGSMLLCLLCLISLTNANNSPTITNVFYEVCEDVPIDGLAFTIEATDPENDPLTFTLSGPDAGYFRVNANTGDTYVRRRLDREGGGLLKPDVVVSDGANSREAQLTIALNDANDNKPIFTQASYDVSYPENTAVGTSLFKVTATDDDTSNAGVVHYSIDGVTPEAGASLFSIVDKTGVVSLAGPLDYNGLSGFYQLKIKATDGGGKCHFPDIEYFSSIVFAFVTVEDVADLDPQFLGVPYVASVAENSPVDLSVIKVTAIDQDTGVNDAMVYSIEASTAEGSQFKISNDGVISVSSMFDREEIGDTVTLTVKATESRANIHGVFASATASVQINIIDVNDSPPEFYKCEGPENEPVCNIATQFTGVVFEHTTGSIPINMMVKDLDKTRTTQLSLDGADKDLFSVEPASTTSDSIVQLLVKQPDKLDFEKIQQAVVQVIAKDPGIATFVTTATVTITIEDTNDNSPTFQQDTYKLTVPEHTPAGTTIETIIAEDPDTMDQGKITYRLLPDSILLYFDVEPTTGAIYVKNETLLDREVRSLYSATLQARDTSGKPGTTVLEITLTDINDQRPVFNRESYLGFVEEHGNFELKIEATDADDPDSTNSQIVYGIEPSEYSDYFTIDPATGVLTNKATLDREAMDPKLDGRIELIVTATDKGTPSLSSTVPVIINVEDINDNVPQFEASSYTFSVKEGVKGAKVGSVYAKDLDQTIDYNRISFSINGGFGSFIIRSSAVEQGYRGEISVDPDIELDYEGERKQYTLQVVAADLEGETASVTVEVNLVDVNDERPEFQPTGPLTVKENTTITGVVGHFVGQDKDGNHSLIYELESMQCRCNGSFTPCSNFILDQTGEITVNPEKVLDYEQCDQVLIEAQVVDEYTEKGENNSVTTGQIVINIEDINDNAPEFIHTKATFVVVSESASLGTQVAEVTAVDRDSGKNGEINFKVTLVQFEDINNKTTDKKLLFTAVTTQLQGLYVGLIQTTEPLDLTLKGKYLVTVTATDTGGLSASTVLEIVTVDESYKVELEFTTSEAEVERDRDEITRALTSATKAAVQIITIRPDTSESRASGHTIVEAYFIYPNGTALTPVEVETKINAPEHYLVLGQLGLMNVGKAPEPKTETDPVQYILMGMVAGLIIVLAVLTTSLMCTRRNYRRKLKAAKAMNPASMVTYDNQKSGPVVPGTNKYTMEGANPVLNLNIDTTMALDMDEESSDVDKVSLSSLDYTDDMNLPDKETKSGMHVIMEEEDDDRPPPEYIEPLGAALAQLGQKKGSNNAQMGFTNPAFSTTDL
ncbi:cadherin-related family member 2 [Pagrus major]|uniref:cadherin-related family member 2 n=1 Tax=Pagrus major TaxID=143350 RepID=UPI003CC88ECC